MAPIKIVITGGAGQIAYSLIPPLCSGIVFGADQPVIISLLDITPAMAMLAGVVMEVEDLAYPLVAGVSGTDDPMVAFKDADYAVFLGAFPRKEGMERKDVMQKNIGIFNSQGAALNTAKPTVKCVVVGNPANTNANILARAAPSIPKKNITALTRLDHNRANSMIAIKCGVSVADVSGVFIWGNHSSTQYPDVRHATVGGEAVMQKCDKEWLEGEFVTTVQKRGAAIIAARKLSSAASAAKAICDHLHDWVLGSDKIISMAIDSTENPYGVPPGLVYSFPVKCSQGEYQIVSGLSIDEFSQAKMDATAAELGEEMQLALSLLG
uniref:Malate dehydrogenase n=1 Tax=Coccolithus braarudii TaxID=221442 RepID=A0A7S0LG24_9EUKA|mmetsp:Transcript_38567/g.82173  ORF Transcript_38567/g.82173 Transcript_38567/m.82173 type:complete len:324 (+) Transcript_38567:40-1011(+)